MSDQTPDTPPDPWVNVRRENMWVQGIRSVWMFANEVDIARAQVEAQHAEEVRRLIADLAECYRLSGADPDGKSKP